MTNKQITPVTFCDENVEKNEQVGVKSINRAAPVDPGSGSGSGLGAVSGLGEIVGHGMIYSTHGCYWNADCNFVWYSSFRYEKRTDGMLFPPCILKIEIGLKDVQVGCSGLEKRDDLNGNIGYQPSEQVLLFDTDLCEEIVDENMIKECEFDFMSPEQEFFVTKLQHNLDGSVSVLGRLSEKRHVKLSVRFKIEPNLAYVKPNDIDPSIKPEIIFVSCEIS